MNFQQAKEILSFVDFRTESLIMIPFAITVALFIIIPLIGFFSGYKRALFWSVGNWAFILIGWGIFALAGDKMSMLLSEFIVKIINNQSPNQAINAVDILPTVKEIFAPLFYLLILFFSNAVLLCVYYLFAKKLLKIHNNKAYIDTPIKNSVVLKLKNSNDKPNFFKRHHVLSKASGGLIFVVAGLPIIMNVSQISYAMTTSYETRGEASNSNSLAKKMSLNLYNFGTLATKYNFTNYWEPITQTVDSTFSLFDMLDRDIYIHSFSEMANFFVWISERNMTTPITADEAAFLNTQVGKWNSIITKEEAKKYANSLATISTFQTFLNIATHFQNDSKIDPSTFNFSTIQNNIVLFETWIIDNNIQLNRIYIATQNFETLVSSVKEMMFKTENINQATDESLQKFVSAIAKNFYNVF